MITININGNWAFILSVALGVIGLLNIPLKNENSWSKTEKLFDKHMDKLTAEFPAQNRDTWHGLKSMLGNTLQQHPSPNPAVITALLPPSMEVGFANCFLKKVAFSVNQAIAAISGNHGNIPILPILLTNSTLEKQNIRRKFEKLGNFAGNPIILLSEDLIKSQTDLELLRDLWTNKNAIGSVATVIFIVRAPDEFANMWHHSKKWEISHKVLTHSWEHIKDNMKYDLISNLTKSVVLLNQGDVCTDTLMFSDYITNTEPSVKLTEVYNNVYKINQRVTNPLIKNQASIKKRVIELEEQVLKLYNQLEYYQTSHKELRKQNKEWAAKYSEIFEIVQKLQKSESSRLPDMPYVIILIGVIVYVAILKNREDERACKT